MNKKTYLALQGSIAKWEGIVDGSVEDEGSDNCPLCQMFFGKSRANCNGCPVMEATGLTSCSSTPYDDFCDAEDFGDEDDCQYAATEMLEFLRALVPAGGPQ